MKLRKFLAGVGALLLCSALLLPVPAQAAEQGHNEHSDQSTGYTHCPAGYWGAWFCSYRWKDLHPKRQTGGNRKTGGTDLYHTAG